MLVLTRKQGQSILIGEDVEITVLETAGEKVRIAIRAPKEISVLRSELAETRNANREAALQTAPDQKELSGLHALLMQSAKKEPQDL